MSLLSYYGKTHPLGQSKEEIKSLFLFLLGIESINRIGKINILLMNQIDQSFQNVYDTSRNYITYYKELTNYPSLLFSFTPLLPFPSPSSSLAPFPCVKFCSGAQILGFKDCCQHLEGFLSLQHTSPFSPLII